ncbi:MAG: 6-carboxytetrahydropterin synthase QueD [Cyanobacteria bacterium NC_groundwater_1444_Ag_S-0.65um_54_12]|nr:6-carboxytetrahydropterin synthase QueD [Cyanobacteria bacterium NC_groundwater_1444_Ag_S-0.65um_54_12]
MAGYEVAKRLCFCYGHRLLEYAGKCRNLHGHNALVEVTISAASLDARGMVIDFNDLKHTLQSWIDEQLDHRMILRSDDPLLPILREYGEPVLALEQNPTAENIARLIFEAGSAEGIELQAVRLWETPDCYAVYSPVCS